jgi:imidazolonepropionase-like amidohydrolase
VTILASAAWGQSRQIPAPPQNDPVVIHGATVHTVSGETIEQGYVAFDEGAITHVGAGPAPAIPGAVQHDAAGLHVYPGLIAAKTNLGLTEIGAVDVSNDHTEFGSVRPEVRAAVAINPDSDLIPVARANGILIGMIFPQGGLVCGRCSAVRFDGWTWEDMTIDPAMGLVISWPNTEPITAWWMNKTPEQQRKEIRESLRRIEEIFDEARAYVASVDNDPTQTTDLRWEAMRPVLARRRPVFVLASSRGQIESAVAWAVRRNLRIVIVGGHEADQVSPLLREHGVPVVIGGLHRLPPRRHASYDQIFTLPVRLHESGVRFCIASGAGAAHERNLNHVAATAAAYGTAVRLDRGGQERHADPH